MKPEEAVEKESRQADNLIEAGITPESRCVRLARAVALLHRLLLSGLAVYGSHRRIWDERRNPFRWEGELRGIDK